MGCHTWFYKKIEVKEEDIVNSVIKMYENVIEYWNLFLYDPLSVDIYTQQTILEYPYIDDDFALNSIAIAERKIRMIKKGLCKEAIREKYCEVGHVSDGLIDYVKGKGFYSDKGTTHDVFRKYGYPDDKLFSYEETIKYIEDPKNECHLTKTLDETKIELKKFWDKFPDGMIDFG